MTLSKEELDIVPTPSTVKSNNALINLPSFHGTVDESDQSYNKGIDDKKAPKLHYFPFFVFLLIGCTQLMGWNSMLNTMGSLFGKILQTSDQTVTVTAVYSTTLTVLTIGFIFVNCVKRRTIFVGLTLILLTALAFGFSAQYASTKISTVLFHSLSSATGISAASVGVAAFGFASQFPYNYSSAVSIGYGLAGVLTFALWLLGTLVLWDNQTSKGIKSSIWLLSSVTMALAVVSIICIVVLFQIKTPEAENASDESEDEEKDLIACDGKTYEKEGLAGVLKRSAPVAALVFLLMFTSLLLFPTFGPIAWYEAKINAYQSANDGDSYPWWFDNERDVLIGTFQIVDFLSRYTSILLPVLDLSAKNAAIVCFLRLLLIPFFILPVVYVKSFLTQFWFLIIQQILLTFTNGWMFTVCFVRVFETVKGHQACARVASFSLLCAYLGIVSGQWCGFGLRKAIG